MDSSATTVIALLSEIFVSLLAVYPALTDPHAALSIEGGILALRSALWRRYEIGLTKSPNSTWTPVPDVTARTDGRILDAFHPC